jgi:hypothetical protein
LINKVSKDKFANWPNWDLLGWLSNNKQTELEKLLWSSIKPTQLLLTPLNDEIDGSFGIYQLLSYLEVFWIGITYISNINLFIKYKIEIRLLNVGSFGRVKLR